MKKLPFLHTFQTTTTNEEFELITVGTKVLHYVKFAATKPHNHSVVEVEKEVEASGYL